MIISIPKILVEKLSQDGADALIHMINESGEATVTKKDLEIGLGGLRAELLKWMFLFWIGQAATVIGIMVAFQR